MEANQTKRKRVGRVTKPCDQCGTMVERPASQFGGRTFCSRPCYMALRWGGTVEKASKPCEHCGTMVERRVTEFRDHVFCSHPCYTASEHHADATRRTNKKRHPNGDPIDVECAHCGVVVRRYPSQVSARNFCSRACKGASAAVDPIRQINPGGYVLVYVGKGAMGATKTGHILEHRKVMQDHLGRALVDDENVHHLNGVRDDNRLENLELWSRSQPSGQRVADKLRWAEEFIARYKE